MQLRSLLHLVVFEPHIDGCYSRRVALGETFSYEIRSWRLEVEAPCRNLMGISEDARENAKPRGDGVASEAQPDDVAYTRDQAVAEPRETSFTILELTLG